MISLIPFGFRIYTSIRNRVPSRYGGWDLEKSRADWERQSVLTLAGMKQMKFLFWWEPNDTKDVCYSELIQAIHLCDLPNRLKCCSGSDLRWAGKCMPFCVTRAYCVSALQSSFSWASISTMGRCGRAEHCTRWQRCRHLKRKFGGM